MDFNEIIKFAFMAFLVQNIVITQFLGLCSFFGVSNKEESAIGMGLSVLAVITMSSIVTYGIYYGILVRYDLTHLRTIVFILVISGFVQLVEMFIKKTAPSLYNTLGIYLPLITTNCTVLGVALLNIDNNFSFVQMLIFSVSTAFGYTFIIYIFSHIREQLQRTPIPQGLKGVPIALFTVGIMSLIMTGF